MIALIDNYDSFTYNVADALAALGRQVRVIRNDSTDPTDIVALEPEAIIISPGPGRPEDSGICLDLIDIIKGRIPLLGICLGHQCIARAFGAKVVRGPSPVHGKTSQVFHDAETIFSGLRNPFTAARYHSLVVPEESVAAPLQVSAFTRSGQVMGLRSAELMIEGVQFHPESIATPCGALLLKNFLTQYCAPFRAAA